MRRTVAILSLACAWLFANGAALDAVQVFAWTRMVRDFSRAGMSLEGAIAKTLDGSAPCKLCCAVAHAKQQQPPASTVEHSTEKLVLACVPVDAVALARPAREWPSLTAASAPMRSEPVPVPPPRV